VKCEAIARYGLTVGDVQDVIESAIGGTGVSQRVEGLLDQRPLRSRRAKRPAEPRARAGIGTRWGQIPFAELAVISVSTAPPTIHDENGEIAANVFVDVSERDLGGYVAEAKRVVGEQVKLPPGYHLEWAGQLQ